MHCLTLIFSISGCLIAHRLDTVALLHICFPCFQICHAHLIIFPTHSRWLKAYHKTELHLTLVRVDGSFIPCSEDVSAPFRRHHGERGDRAGTRAEHGIDHGFEGLTDMDGCRCAYFGRCRAAYVVASCGQLHQDTADLTHEGSICGC